MPSVNYTTLLNLINASVRNYPQEAFHNMELNRILQLIIQWIDSGGTTGPVVSANVYPVTVANFTTAVDCPIPALNGENILVFWNATGKFLVKGSDWSDYAGGGFTITIPGYDSSTTDANFYVYISA